MRPTANPIGQRLQYSSKVLDGTLVMYRLHLSTMTHIFGTMMQIFGTMVRIFSTMMHIFDTIFCCMSYTYQTADCWPYAAFFFKKQKKQQMNEPMAKKELHLIRLAFLPSYFGREV